MLKSFKNKLIIKTFNPKTILLITKFGSIVNISKPSKTKSSLETTFFGPFQVLYLGKK